MLDERDNLTSAQSVVGNEAHNLVEQLLRNGPEHLSQASSRSASCSWRSSSRPPRVHQARQTRGTPPGFPSGRSARADSYPASAAVLAGLASLVCASRERRAQGMQATNRQVERLSVPIRPASRCCVEIRAHRGRPPVECRRDQKSSRHRMSESLAAPTASSASVLNRSPRRLHRASRPGHPGAADPRG